MEIRKIPPARQTAMLTDSFSRKIDYLRLSVTDRCNLRCRYCAPDGQTRLVPHSHLLTYNELLRISRVAVENGIKKIRVTGGEPLLREGIIGFLYELKQLEGLRELVLTTNGIKLDQYARKLKEVGLERVNVSLDSLIGQTYKNITGGNLVDVLRSLYEAEKAGLRLKLNVVVMRGINDNEIEDFVLLTIIKDISVRFIEYMPIGNSRNWRHYYMPTSEILKRITDKFELRPVENEFRAGPSQNYRLDGATGTIGLISPVSSHFCPSCNRIRVSAIGKARSCLFSKDEIDLRKSLILNSDILLKRDLHNIVFNKQETHGMTFGDGGATALQMSSIGG